MSRACGEGGRYCLQGDMTGDIEINLVAARTRGNSK